MSDHKAMTTPSLEDARAVATAFARVAADLCGNDRVNRLRKMLLMSDVSAVESLVRQFREEYNEHGGDVTSDVQSRCEAAFAIGQAADALDEQNPYEASLIARGARNSCECVVQCIDFGVVDLSGPNHAASLAKVHALAAKYVSAATIAAVLA
jgi:hypothetical protein